MWAAHSLGKPPSGNWPGYLITPFRTCVLRDVGDRNGELAAKFNHIIGHAGAFPANCQLQLECVGANGRSNT